MFRLGYKKHIKAYHLTLESQRRKICVDHHWNNIAMKSKIAELILIASVVGIAYTDVCVYSPWKRGDCNCRTKTMSITRTLLTGGEKCDGKTELKEPCDCSKWF